MEDGAISLECISIAFDCFMKVIKWLDIPSKKNRLRLKSLFQEVTKPMLQADGVVTLDPMVAGLQYFLELGMKMPTAATAIVALRCAILTKEVANKIGVRVRENLQQDYARLGRKIESEDWVDRQAIPVWPSIVGLSFSDY